MVDTRPLDERSVTALEEERDFLLRSIDDLERERDAGDVDDHDYEALRDDYTTRAAAILRTIDARRARVVAPTGRWRRAGWVAAVVVLGALAGILVARSTGSRGAGEITGDVTESTRTLLFEAGQAGQAGDWDTAIDRYTEVLELQPSNGEAYAYRGWSRRNAGDDEGALADLDQAVALAPAFPDALVFRSSVRLRTGDVDGARADLAALDALDAPAEVLSLVDAMGLRADVVSTALLTEGAPALADSGYGNDEVVDAAVSIIVMPNADLVTAAMLLELVLADDPDDPRALAYRGYIFAVAASASDDDALIEEARTRLDHAIEVDPSGPDALAVRAVFRATVLDDAEGAAVDLEAYVATGDRTPHLLDLLRNAGLTP